MKNTNAEDESCLPPTDGTVSPELTTEDKKLSPEAQKALGNIYELLLKLAATGQIKKNRLVNLYALVITHVLHDAPISFTAEVIKCAE